MSANFCICAPARNEADHIAAFIQAVASQSVTGPVPIALCVNNTNDGTAAIAATAAARTAGRVDLAIVETWFDDPLAHAGSARKAAMDLGASLTSSDGLLISTDADCRPPSDWIDNIIAVSTPETIVGGKIELDEDDHVPEAILTIRRRFDLYWRKVRAIEDEIDPCAWDPAPRHGDHTGASLALSRDLYHRAGGVPLIPTGEDRALVAAAMAAGGKLVHPLSVWTRVSARVAGRAVGGMADDMRRWADIGATGSLAVPAFAQWRERAAWRAERRSSLSVGEIVAAEASLPPMSCDMMLPECEQALS